jgi:cell division inhibitor SepF
MYYSRDNSQDFGQFNRETMIQNNLIPFPVTSEKNPDVVVMELTSEEETPQAMQALQERKMVILKLARLAPARAQRIVDWMSGSTYAIDGQIEWLGEQTFLFAPSSFQVTSSRPPAGTVTPPLRQSSGRY